MPPTFPSRSRSHRLWWILLAVALALALEVAFWGRPVPAKFEIIRSGSGTPCEWVIARRASPPELWRARDINNDGVMDEFHTPTGAFTRPGLRSEPKRWLVICLDGVPLGEMQRLWDRGHFREFCRPTVTVSTLPSDSEAALTEALHAAAGHGYEHRYFDRAHNQMRGGIWVTLTGAGVPYLRVLDYDAPGWAKGIVYVISAKSYHADLGRLRKAFLVSRQSIFLAHVATSDSLFHLLPSAQVEPFLLEFESLVRDSYLEARGELGVLLFSDHGNTQTPSHAVPLEHFLAQRGWRLRDTLAGPRDVAVPAYGLIGFIAMYCQPAAEASLAHDLTALEGVDLVITRDAETGGATILRGPARARLRWTSDGSRFWYEAQQGDPLELLPVFEKLRAAGRLARNGSAGDADVFATTWESHYPDASARIRTWAINHVQNPADILVSLKPGYFYGKGIFQHMVSFSGTHGALDASSSLGFAMATHPLPPAVRLADLLPKEFLKNRNGTPDEH